MKNFVTVKISLSLILVALSLSVALFAYLKLGKSTGIVSFKPSNEIATDASYQEYKGTVAFEIPKILTYPGATLVGSAKSIDENINDQGYRVKWTTSDPVSTVMKWYQLELFKVGWVFEPPDDVNAQGEQVAQIARGDLKGQLIVERNGDETEILIDLRKITK